VITVSQILKDKGNKVWTVAPEARVFDALKLMAGKSVGALLVVDKEQVVGIISERDYARKVILKGKSSADTLVRDIMTSRIFGVHPDTKVEECLALMTDKHVRHLPVFDKDRLVGFISIGDVVKAVVSQQKVLIAHLENYISGKYL
jgi:CBS domain-containing protein